MKIRNLLFSILVFISLNIHANPSLSIRLAGDGVSSNINNIWQDHGAGHDVQNITVYRAKPVLTGGDRYYSLGDYAVPNYDNWPRHSPILVKSLETGALARPTGYERIWTDAGSGADDDIAFWKPHPKQGYTCLGSVASNNHNATPSVDAIRCVRNDLTEVMVPSTVWTDKHSGADADVTLVQVQRQDYLFYSPITAYNFHTQTPGPVPMLKKSAFRMDYGQVRGTLFQIKPVVNDNNANYCVTSNGLLGSSISMNTCLPKDKVMKWKQRWMSDEQGRLHSAVDPNLCIQIMHSGGGGAHIANAIQLNHCSESDRQKFTGLEHLEAGQPHSICGSEWQNHSSCLDRPGGSEWDGMGLQVAGSNGTISQRYKIERVYNCPDEEVSRVLASPFTSSSVTDFLNTVKNMKGGKAKVLSGTKANGKAYLDYFTCPNLKLFLNFSHANGDAIQLYNEKLLLADDLDKSLIEFNDYPLIYSLGCNSCTGEFRRVVVDKMKPIGYLGYKTKIINGVESKGAKVFFDSFLNKHEDAARSLDDYEIFMAGILSDEVSKARNAGQSEAAELIKNRRPAGLFTTEDPEGENSGSYDKKFYYEEHHEVHTDEL